MDKLSRKEVVHIAKLANLSLTEEEVTLFQDQLTSVIEYNMNLLSEVDVTSIAPTFQTTGLTNVWQDDEAKASFSQEQALSQAPKQKNGMFKVKRVLGEA